MATSSFAKFSEILSKSGWERTLDLPRISSLSLCRNSKEVDHVIRDQKHMKAQKKIPYFRAASHAHSLGIMTRNFPIFMLVVSCSRLSSAIVFALDAISRY